MEIHKLPSNGDVKASKKSKAAGAFRVLFNLLHKPGKKRVDIAPTDKTLTTINCHDHDTAYVPPAKKVCEKTGESASPCPYTGRDSDRKESVSLEIPEVKNIESVIFYHSSDSGVRDNVEDKGDDDDVFLDESYFEDDYIEDFSGSSSEYNSDVYRCCDVPEDNFDDAFDDCMDIFGSYNNLNIMETVYKPYHKVIPDFITTLDKSPKLNSKPVSTRKRRYSLPDDLARMEAPPDACPIRKDIVNKYGLKRLYSCVEYTHSKPDVKTTASTREQNLVSINVDLFQDSVAQKPSSKTDVHCPTIPFMNDLSEMLVSNPSENKLDPDMEKASIKNQNDQMTHWESISELKSSRNDTDIKSRVFDKSGDLAITPDAVLQAISTKPEQVLLEEAKDEMNVNSRRSSHGSIESGYMTSGRASSSAPLSPTKKNLLSPSLEMDLMTTMPSPFTFGQLDEMAFYESTSPIFTKPPTPLHKLHSGTPLSPHSRDTIDGIADAKKPRPHPRKSLKPKFIFPSPNINTISTASSASNLKPVAELGESPSGNSNEHNEHESEYQHKDARLTSKTNITEQKTVERREDSSPSIHIGVNIGDQSTHEKTISNPIDINLNVSVSIVDMNKVTRAEKEIPENQPGAMSCFPPSPSDIKATTLRTPSTPTQESRTPTHRITTLTDYLNDIVVTSPFGKAVRPICTSSPLPNKFAPNNRRMANSATENRTVALESSPILPLEIDYRRSAHEPDGKSKPRGNAQRSNSDRRKRLVKRKSARARLDFDGQGNLNDSDLKYDTCANIPGFQQPMSGDYVLLKRIAEQIVLQCPNRELIFSWVDVPALMENMKGEYDKIMKSDYFKSKRVHRVSHLKGSLNNARHNMLSNVTLDNCLDILLMSLLVQDKQRISASLDFVFENLPRVIHKHRHLSHLAPEVVMLLLCNQRCVVKNNHGFSLSYSQSEKEVFKAVVKYVDSVQKRNGAKHSFVTRVKNLLSIVADPRALTIGNTSSADKRLLKESQPLQSICQLQSGYSSSSAGPIFKKPPPPRPFHKIKFTKSSQPYDRDREYFFQPFLSSHIHSLDEINIAKGAGVENAAPISMAAISDENLILRKLYFSYRRCNISYVPYISKIGMQYSHKGKKKTVFVAASRLETSTAKLVSGSMSDKRDDDIKLSDSTSSKTETDVHDTANVAIEGATRHTLRDTTTKKAAIVLRAGEHVTGIYVLGRRVHNIEVVTNTGRRIRAHSLQDAPSDAKWVALATPNGNDPVCLHALYGDLHTSSSGRSHIRDIGALWISTTPSEMNDLG